MDTDVLFVQMPYTGLVRPSPSLGILQAILKERGIRTETVYADLDFAELAGLWRISLVNSVPPHDMLGDWTFSNLAFPESENVHWRCRQLLVQNLCIR